MRLFTAIDLPAEMLEKLREFLSRVRPLARLRWSPIENLHITTKFIGEWPEARLDEMKQALAGVARPGAIHISVKSVGCFPDARKPRVSWAGVDGGEALTSLAHETEQAVAKLGVEIETRAYSPHLTLARVKDAGARLDAVLLAAGNPDFGAFDASSFFLYLSRNGKYSKLAEFPLIS